MGIRSTGQPDHGQRAEKGGHVEGEGAVWDYVSADGRRQGYREGELDFRGPRSSPPPPPTLKELSIGIADLRRDRETATAVWAGKREGYGITVKTLRARR